MTPELRKRIEDTFDQTELEDIYLPYKPKRKTRATTAIEKGLEPLAKIIFEQQEQGIQEKAAEFVNEQVKDSKEALQGARDIIAEWISEHEQARLQIAPATKNYINSKIIWGIGIFFLTLLIGVIGYGLSQINWSSGGDTNLPVDLTKVNWDKMFNNTYTNAFIMINTVLGLMLIDMYLGKKKQERMGNNVK